MKIFRITRVTGIINKLKVSAADKSAMKILYVLFLLFLFHHMLACALWFIFSIEKYWVPPKDFGYLQLDFMEVAPFENTLAQNYFLMFYHATFIFNMVDVAPVTYTEISTVIIVIVISAFANALLYGTFFSLRREQN